jgi:DNA-binding response OmpR family regulator
MGSVVLLSDPEPLVKDLELLPGRMAACVDGRVQRFTEREFEVLTVLFENAGKVVERPDLYTAVWGGRMPYRDRSVDVFVRKVRLKLAAAAPDRDFIRTHYGIGYRLEPRG